MVNVAVVVIVLPHASLTVNITVVLPVPPHPSLRPVKLLLHVNSLLQAASIATAPAWVFNQLMSASLLPFPSHCTVRFAAAVVMTGAVLSVIDTSTKHVDVLPAASVAVI
jgi:hypothetical protein